MTDEEDSERINHSVILTPPEPIEDAKAALLEVLEDGPFPYQFRTDEFKLVWFSKQLGQWKTLFYVKKVRGLYAEITNNGVGDIYVDIYRKVHNQTITRQITTPKEQ